MRTGEQTYHQPEAGYDGAAAARPTPANPASIPPRHVPISINNAEIIGTEVESFAGNIDDILIHVQSEKSHTDVRLAGNHNANGGNQSLREIGANRPGLSHRDGVPSASNRSFSPDSGSHPSRYQLLSEDPPSRRLKIPEVVPDDLRINDIRAKLDKIVAEKNYRTEQRKTNVLPKLESLNEVISAQTDELGRWQTSYSDALGAIAKKVARLTSELEARDAREKEEIKEHENNYVQEETAKTDNRIRARSRRTLARAEAEELAAGELADWLEDYSDALAHIKKIEFTETETTNNFYTRKIEKLELSLSQLVSQVESIKQERDEAIDRDRKLLDKLGRPYLERYKFLVAAQQVDEIPGIAGIIARKKFSKGIMPSKKPATPASRSSKGSQIILTPASDQIGRKRPGISKSDIKERSLKRRTPLLAAVAGFAIAASLGGAYLNRNSSTSSANSANATAEVPTAVKKLEAIITASMSTPDVAAPVMNSDGSQDTYNIFNGTLSQKAKSPNSTGKNYSGFLEAMMAETSAGNPDFQCNTNGQSAGNPDMLCGLIPIPKTVGLKLASKMGISPDSQGKLSPDKAIPLYIRYFNQAAVTLLDGKNAIHYAKSPSQDAQTANANFIHDAVQLFGIQDSTKVSSIAALALKLSH